MAAHSDSGGNGVYQGGGGSTQRSGTCFEIAGKEGAFRAVLVLTIITVFTSEEATAAAAATLQQQN